MAIKSENPRIRHYIHEMFLRNPILTSMAILAHFTNKSFLATANLPNGLKITGDLADGYFAAVAMNKYLEPEVDAFMAQSLSAGDTFIDIGANIGIKTATGYSFVGEEGRVIAIEPTPRTYEILNRNTMRWSPTAIISLNLALSDTKNISRLKDFGPSRSGLNTLNSNPRSSAVLPHTEVSIFQTTLDNLDQTPSLVKIDAEGREYKILLGSYDTLQTVGPDIIFETGNPDTPDAFKLLSKYGYSFFAFSANRIIEKIANIDQNRHLNVLASKKINH